VNRKVINELKLKRMATKIRLARHGRKGRPFYHVVVADSRAPRDGRYIERIGSYNPMTNPATIDLNFDRALYWLMTGAQPTDTAKRILSYEGVLMKKHLLEGVKKGAFDMAAADTKFEAWKKEKKRLSHSPIAHNRLLPKVNQPQKLPYYLKQQLLLYLVHKLQNIIYSLYNEVNFLKSLPH